MEILYSRFLFPMFLSPSTPIQSNKHMSRHAKTRAGRSEIQMSQKEGIILCLSVMYFDWAGDIKQRNKTIHWCESLKRNSISRNDFQSFTSVRDVAFVVSLLEFLFCQRLRSFFISEPCRVRQTNLIRINVSVRIKHVTKQCNISPKDYFMIIVISSIIFIVKGARWSRRQKAEKLKLISLYDVFAGSAGNKNSEI